MDDDDVENAFMNMHFNNYAEAIEQFIEFTRMQHIKIQEAIMNNEPQVASDLAAEMFMASSRVQVGNVQNLIAAYAGTLFRERAAAVELHDLLEWVLAELKKFHAHLVYVNQPLEELAMVTDLMVELGNKVEGSSIGQTLKQGES